MYHPRLFPLSSSLIPLIPLSYLSYPLFLKYLALLISISLSLSNLSHLHTNSTASEDFLILSSHTPKTGLSFNSLIPQTWQTLLMVVSSSKNAKSTTRVRSSNAQNTSELTIGIEIFLQGICQDTMNLQQRPRLFLLSFSQRDNFAISN